MKAMQPVLAPRGQLDRLSGCYPVDREQILLPRASQGRRIRSDRPGIRGMSANKSLHFSRLSTSGGPRLCIRALIMTPSGGFVGSLYAFATAGIDSHLARSWGKSRIV